MLDLVTDGYNRLESDATEAQKIAQKALRKKDQKVLFYIPHCVNVTVFENIADSEKAKIMGHTLVRCYGGDTSVKKVKL